MISGSEYFLIRALAYAFVAVMMFSVGARVAVSEIAAVLKNRGLMIRSLAANFALVPALGWVVCTAIPLAADTASAVLLLSIAPGAPFAIQFTSKRGEALAAVLAFTLSLAAAVVVPPAAGVLALPGTPAPPGTGRIIVIVSLVQLLPLLAGTALRELYPSAAGRLARPCGVASAVIFAAIVLLTMGVRSAAVRSVGAGGSAAMALLILGSVLIGWLLGGPGPAARATLAMQTGFRNVALCLAIAVHMFPGTGVDAAVIAYSALVIPALFLFSIIVRPQ